MAVPSVATYSVDAKEEAHKAFRDLIDAGSAAGRLKIRDASDVLLADIPLGDPCGTVSAVTGVLTFDVTAAEDSSADATGTAAYGEFTDSDDNVHLSLPTQAGTAAVSGKLVLNTLSIVSGGPVTLVSASIG
jgi:hypothetical protein